MFTFSVVVCVLTHPSLALTAPLSLCGSCLWVMSCLVSRPLQLGAPPTLLAYHHSASVFLTNTLSASSSLTLSPPTSHHRAIFLQDHRPSSLLPVGPGMSSATTASAWTPWRIFTAAALSNVVEKKKKKITPLSPKRRRFSSKIFCQVTFYNICCDKQIAYFLVPPDWTGCWGSS